MQRSTDDTTHTKIGNSPLMKWGLLSCKIKVENNIILTG